MRILKLLKGLHPNGITTHSLDLAEGLLKENYTVHIIRGDIPKKDNHIQYIYQKTLEAGVTAQTFQFPNGNILKKLTISLKSIIQIIYYILKYQPDLIHCQSPHMSFIPWLMRKKFVTTVHSLAWKESFQFKKPNHLIAMSKESYEFGKNFTGLQSRNISLIHHGIAERFSTPIDKNAQQELKIKLNIPKRKIIIGMVARIEHNKGQDIMVEALKNLDISVKNRIHFVFLGGSNNTKETKWLEKLVDDSKICDFVSIVPFTDPKPFYDIFEVFVLPSRSEAFPLVVVEAMMSSCCIIRSNTGGAHEQIEENFNGLLFENEDTFHLTKHIEKLVNNNSKRKEMMTNSKKKALSEFTIPIMTKNTVKVYRQVMAE